MPLKFVGVLRPAVYHLRQRHSDPPESEFWLKAPKPLAAGEWKGIMNERIALGMGELIRMEVLCRCSNCATQFKVDAKFGGRKAKCPRCASAVLVPLVASADTQGRIGRFAEADATQEGVTVSDFPDLQSPKPSQPQRTRSSSPAAASGARLGPQAGPADSMAAALQIQVESPSVSSKPRKPSRRKRPNVTWIIAAAVVAVLLVIVGVIAIAFRVMGPGQDPVLVLEWPERDRKGDGAIDLDGKRHSLPTQGEIRLPLSVGPHRLVLRRRGYQPIEWPFAATRGQVVQYRPVWELVNFDTPGGPKSGGSPDPQLPNELVVSPLGFPGWMQLLDRAKRQASEKKRDIFMVFGGSDWHRDSIQMANEIFSNPKFLAHAQQRFILVVIDAPRTAAGLNLLADSGQNQHLLRMYDLTRSNRLPHVAMLDSRGLPYARDGYFAGDVDKYVQHLTLLQAAKTERDTLLAAVQSTQDAEGRLNAAERAIRWLRNKELSKFYLSDIQQWLALARRVDPKNELGKLEVFFVEEWFARLAAAARDKDSLKPLLDEFLQWSQQHKFQDSDRVVQMHLIAAALLFEVFQDGDEASKHISIADTYVPNDSKLKERLQEFTKRLNERDELSSGSGFVISAEGHILTNHHVIEGPGNTIVRLPDSERRIVAKVLAFDNEKDLALLQVDPQELNEVTPLVIGNSQTGRGTSVAAFGFPLGNVLGGGLKLTSGLITGTDQEGQLLIDVRINPGNSGGPLCNKLGQVVGMVTAKSYTGEGLDSYGMAVPARDLRAFVETTQPTLELAYPDSGEQRPLEWQQVDSIVQNSVVMILKIKE